jgi:NAD(P)-dependent dehydrogenase (short-subunit alcohol dehydrogenase family)
MVNPRLEGKRAFVTGASSGIGNAIARRFLAEGAQVVGCGRRPECELKDSGFSYVAADLTSFEAASAAVHEAARRLGGLDIVVNSAGITGEGTIETTESADFRQMFDVNVLSVFNVCKAAAAFLKQGRGPAIVNLASDLGVRPIAGRVAYSPSKAAVVMLTRCIALELAPVVRANTLLPGLVETPMIHHRFESAPDPEALRQSMADLYLLKRIGSMEDMTTAALYLAGDESSFMTGGELPVCGGSLI